MVSIPKAVTTDGVWHGAVPAGWSLKQLKWAVTFQRGHDLPTEDRQEGPVPVVTGAGITGWHNVAQARGPGIVTGRYGTIGEFHLVEQDYWPLNTSLYSIDLHGNHAGFLRYMLEPLAPLFHLNAAKSAVPGIDRSDIHTIPVAVPPLATQRAIADYLDRETARLAGLVAAKERVLGLLAEKRRALITRAITRGLDLGAPLRDSGTPWLGEIPAHWDTSKFSWSVFIVEGQVDPEVEPYLSMLLVAPNHIESGTSKLISRETAAEQAAISGKYLCQKGDVIYSKIRPALRKATLAPEECLCSADMYPLRVRQGLDAEYLLFFLLSEPFSTWAVLESDRVAMPKINRETLNDLHLPVPPMSEQCAIVTHIATETAMLDALRSATERTIALLKERHAALIAAAVTGRLYIAEAA